MIYSLVICTYMRPQAIVNLLQSVKKQTLYPDEILVVDGSVNAETETVLKENSFKNLKYFRVSESDRGLTKQRNIGVKQVSGFSEIICFLDDDVILELDYFEQLVSTYSKYPSALAVGGYIINETKWERSLIGNDSSHFYFDGWKRKEPSRFIMRKVFGLEPDTNPGFLPTFAHGRALEFLPPSGEIYEVEQLMGGASSYRKTIFNSLSFSTYFIGYGLYEDTEFALRLAKKGKLFINTRAQLYHYHNASGRPNQFKYGKMVIRNGWYIWRIKYPNPTLKAQFKWHATAFLLILIRFSNILNTSKRLEAFTESIGRVYGWVTLVFNKPKIQY